MFFINEAMAESAEAAQGFQGITATMVPLLIFVVIFYFLLIRPQQKRQKEHEKEVSSLKPNDKVLTAGGIYGTIKKVKEKTLVVEIADGVDIEVVSDMVGLISGKNEKTEEKKPLAKDKKSK